MAEDTSKRSSGGLTPFIGGTMGSLWKEMDDMFKNFPSIPGLREGSGFVPLDLSETDDAVEAKLDLPGFKPEDIHLEVHGDRLTVKGERTETKEEKDKTWHRTERRTGSFSRLVPLPCAVDEEKVDANYEDGVLTIRLPKRADAKGRKIPVKKG
jgi:HSP20 family protein